MKIKSLKLACVALDPTRFPNTPWVEIAVSGRSNVGKSSLLNTILGRRNLARISKEPGKTRTVNFYLVNDRFYLVDLPGYGYAKVSAEARKRWQRAVFEYIDKREALGGVVQLVDSRHPPSAEDMVMLQRLVDSERPFLVALTKSDKIKRSERPRVMKTLRSHLSGMAGGLGPPGREIGAASSPKDLVSEDTPAIFFSSKTGEGKELLWKWIDAIIG